MTIQLAYEYLLTLMSGGADFGDALDAACERFPRVEREALADYFTEAEA